jgi:hypothetical protein
MDMYYQLIRKIKADENKILKKKIHSGSSGYNNGCNATGYCTGNLTARR